MWRGLHPNHIISFIGGLYMGFTPIFIKKRWTTLIFPYFKRPPTPTTPPPVRSAYRPPSRSLRFGCASQSAESPDDRAAEPDPYRPGSRGVAGNNPTKKGFFNGEHGDQLWDFEVYGIPDFQPNPCDFRWCSKMFFSEQHLISSRPSAAPSVVSRPYWTQRSRWSNVPSTGNRRETELGKLHLGLSAKMVLNPRNSEFFVRKIWDHDNHQILG